MSDNRTAVYLKNYRPVPQDITHVHLTVALHPTATRVLSRLTVTPNEQAPLVLNGEGLELVSVKIDDADLAIDQFTYEQDILTIRDIPASPFTLRIEQICNPEANTALSGLYLSNGVYCTQMEAEGFRRFAFMHDRPDVMATYDVRIVAPDTLPVLLSNGNPGASGKIANSNMHFAEWTDPHPKPTYLFALVAGDLASVDDQFVTASGRQVRLGVYVEKGKQDRCQWAIESLQASMHWDEQTFGREYDLEVFNIVAVSHFNMGAMENKGLNIFNDKYVLARPDTATDGDYINIERIIAHEYFHNWTGNRITCRDWFQLCLKEGLTVFRDQEFTSDRRSRAVKRIEDVRTLRTRQFPEDQGPLSHPVRPDSYIEINNFYTPTVYEKGAELCRMMKTLIGPENFAKGLNLYFERHDGKAVTVEDFIDCMREASGRDLKQFFRWYEQSGTPTVAVTTRHDAETATFEIEVTQSTPATPGQAEKLPLHFPLSLGLVSANGEDMPLQLAGKGALPTPILEITRERQVFCFTGLPTRPVLSINRGFSAPVNLKTDTTAEGLLFLLENDCDAFNRWEAAQTLARNLLMDATASIANGKQLPSVDRFANALKSLLSNPQLDTAFKSLMLELPSEAEIAAAIGQNVDSDMLHDARSEIRARIARALLPALRLAFDDTIDIKAYAPDPASTARRSLHAAALSLIAAANPSEGLALAERELQTPGNMTVEIAALAAVLPMRQATPLLDSFIARHRNDHLLVDKWLFMEAQRTLPFAAARAERLTHHELFSWTTPNRVLAVFGGLMANHPGFHAADGEGYRVAADAIIKLNGINPQVAARVATCFRSWRQYDASRQNHAEAHLRRILAAPGLSPDVDEIISRTLS
jgi:aminopeptidase N